MTETFTALLFAHVLADFVLQTRWIVANKRRLAVLALHGAIVLACAQAALGQVAAPELLALAGLHLLIDALKVRAPARLGPFIADQAAHLGVVLAIALWSPGLWAGGLWAQAVPAPVLPGLFALAAGALLAVRAGGFAVALLMQAHLPPGSDSEGLPAGGLTIGYLERGLIFVLILAGQAGAIGFLIAAKSILRFGTVGGDRKASEYVIIGTLASFGWAICAALATQGLLAHLPPLEIAIIQP
ncbi:MAG: DUF3307 domain-containing protein [Paracoccaceae bacterium]